MKHKTKYRLRAASVGAAAAAIGVGAVTVVGYVSDLEALDLLSTMLPTTRFFCSAVMTGTATILALMVTMVSLSSSADMELKAKHYQRIQQIALLDSMGFVGAMLLLLFIMIPMEETGTLPLHWYRVIYYVVLGWAALLGGVVVAVVMMLYSEVNQLIRAIGLDRDSALVQDEETQEEPTGGPEPDELSP